MDVKFLKMVSNRLDGFVEKSISPYQSICRCPICGDSQKKKTKKRGYFYEQPGMVMYHCFNCEASIPFGKFLKDFDSATHKQYCLEVFKDSTQGTVHAHKKVEPDFKTQTNTLLSKSVSDSYLANTELVMDLPDAHAAKQYLLTRKIPTKYQSQFYYTDSFFSWSKTNTDKFQSVLELGVKDHPRIIMPWYNQDGYMFAYQARSINGEDPKYYTIVLNTSFSKFFGLERVDFKGKIYCVEGPIDSLFLPNCVAVGSSALTTFDDNLRDVVYCHDNEPRNPDIVRLIGKTILQKKKVVIFPDNYHYKDLNEAIMDGTDQDDLLKIIESNTFVGPAALMRYNQWKRS